ncbi:hypothetical protein [Sandaracinus amylolyticus]|uniref:hypothetical protein n=1 Tax=Sandaracinus amylolyticus TaxID=927083 RepID=UPI0012ECBEB7|nr:hypothetical protein [Sandaracinus amylolyticus]
MTRSHALLVITMLLGGCVTEASLLSSPSTPSCSEDVDVVTAPAEVGCTSIEVEGSDEAACDTSSVPDAGASPIVAGRRVRVRRAHDLPTVMRVELLVSPSTCTVGPCPRDLYWHGGGGCECGVGLEGGGFESGVYEVRVPPGDSTVLLPDPSRRYRVSACTMTSAPWPTYPECGLSGFASGEQGGTCQPSCFTDADCPVPSSGTAVPDCDVAGTSCSLDCGAGQTCPDGQVCGAVLGRLVCVVPDA